MIFHKKRKIQSLHGHFKAIFGFCKSVFMHKLTPENVLFLNY